MPDQLIEWLSDKFGDELRSWLPSAAILAATLWVLLAWAAKYGEYESAFLSLMQATPKHLAEETSSVSTLPLYVFASAAVGSLVVYGLLRLLARWYFRTVCDLPAHKSHIIQMLEQHKTVRVMPLGALLDELRESEEELARRRSSVRIAVQMYEWTALLGVAIAAASYLGNRLDAAIGAGLLVIAVIALYRAVGTFLSKVTPWYAKVEALSLRKTLSQGGTSEGGV